MHCASEVFGSLRSALDERLVDDYLTVTSVSALFCQASTCRHMGSKFRCIRSMPIESESSSEKRFECFAKTGLNTPGTMFPDSDPLEH